MLGAMQCDASADAGAIDLACLCAAWCRLCDGYAEVFDATVAELRRTRPRLRSHWIDIEDEADLVGDLDVETFPTIVLADAAGVRFAGALTPQPAVLLRVLGAALAGGAALADAAAARGVAERLRRRAPDQAGGAPLASNTPSNSTELR